MAAVPQDVISTNYFELELSKEVLYLTVLDEETQEILSVKVQNKEKNIYKMQPQFAFKCATIIL